MQFMVLKKYCHPDGAKLYANDLVVECSDDIVKDSTKNLYTSTRRDPEYPGEGAGKTSASRVPPKMELYNTAFKERRKNVTGPGSLYNEVLEYFQYGYITNNWDKLLRRTGILMRWWPKVKKMVPLAGAEREVAAMFWFRAAMPATWEAGKKGKLKRLTPVQHDVYEDLLVM